MTTTTTVDLVLSQVTTTWTLRGTLTQVTCTPAPAHLTGGDVTQRRQP